MVLKGGGRCLTFLLNGRCASRISSSFARPEMLESVLLPRQQVINLKPFYQLCNKKSPDRIFFVSEYFPKVKILAHPRKVSGLALYQSVSAVKRRRKFFQLHFSEEHPISTSKVEIFISKIYDKIMPRIISAVDELIGKAQQTSSK